MKAIVFVLAILSVAFAVFDDSARVMPTFDLDNQYIYVFKPEIPEDQSLYQIFLLTSFFLNM